MSHYSWATMHFWEWFGSHPFLTDVVLWAGCCLLGLLFYCLNYNGKLDKPAHLPESLTRSSEDIARATDAALEDETRANWDFCQHLWNRPWSSTPQGRDKVPVYDSNEAWLKGQPFPDGEERLNELWPSTIAVWKFYYSRRKPHRPALQAFLAGMCPHVISLLISSIVREISSNDQDACLWKLPLLGFGIVSVKAVGLALEYYASLKFPVTGLQHELRVRLQREFFEMDNKQREKWPPGKIVALLDSGVEKFIFYVWLPLLHVIRFVGSLVAVVLLIPCIVPDDPLGALFHAGIIIFIAALSFLVFSTRGVAGHDLAIRTRDWMFAWMSLMGAQLTTQGGDPQKLNAELCATAWVYRKRDYHLRIKAEAADDMLQLFTTTLYTFLAFYWGFSVRTGRMQLATAVSILTIVWNLGTAGGNALISYRGFLEGHAYLLPIAEVLNHEEFSEALLETDESDSSELV